MNLDKLSGFVIKKNDYGATDEIVTILTIDKLFTFIALGTRKLQSKNRNALQMGNFIDIDFFRARLTNKVSKLKKATTIIQPKILDDNNAETIFEIFSSIAKIQKPSKLLFEALIDCYSYVGVDYNSHIKTFVHFALLDSLGILPSTNKCTECGRNDRINGFEFYNGGFTCINHTKKVRTLDELIAFQNLFNEFLEYSKTDANINANIYKEIKIFISENTFD